MQSLKTQTNPTIRRSLHTHLEQLCRLLGQPTPALDAIGQEAPAEPPLVGEFWIAYNQLIAAGAKVNHSRNPQVIAINLHHIGEVARKYRVRLPSWSELRNVLKKSLHPKFIDIRGVNSVITGTSVKCWAFVQPEEEEKLPMAA
ncbi:MAG TPA: hypothetical protein VM571_11485 [Noviherbaspirillum sp.]|nr:hypothetical protein [Noviherbaspirillum sp.]